MSPKELAELMARTATADGIDERQNIVILRGSLPTEREWRSWLSLEANPPAFVRSVNIAEADTDSPLSNSDCPAPDEQFQFVIEKTITNGELRLFFSNSLPKCSDGFSRSENVLIADMGSEETFSTFRNRVQLWSEDPVAEYGSSEPLPDPRKFCRDFTSKGAVVADIRAWLLRSAPSQEGQAYIHWRAAAAKNLLAAISNQVSLNEDGRLNYHFSGPPACIVNASDQETEILWDRLLSSATWVYADGVRDAESRHVLLSHEWARSFRKNGLREFGDNSLESARSAYDAFVKVGSKETLKAIADLRKAVVEEAQKVSQRAQDLSGALWKDILIAAAPFVLKIVPDSAKVDSAWVTTALAFGAATFLGYSFSIQVYINKRYFRQQREARKVWRIALDAALSASELEEYGEKPIRKSIDDYRRVRRLVGLVYAVLIGLLFYYGYQSNKYELQASLLKLNQQIERVAEETKQAAERFITAKPSPQPKGQNTGAGQSNTD